MLAFPSPLPMLLSTARSLVGMVRPFEPDEFDGVPLFELLPHAVSVNASAAISMVAAFQPRMLEPGCISVPPLTESPPRSRTPDCFATRPVFVDLLTRARRPRSRGSGEPGRP